MLSTTLSGLAGLRVLVVEDEYMVAEHIVMQLEDFGCEIVGSVATVEQALVIVENERLDGALLDANLNGDSSAPIATALYARSVPFVIITGYGRLELASPILNHAPRLTKPFNTKDLERTLATAFLR